MCPTMSQKTYPELSSSYGVCVCQKDNREQLDLVVRLAVPIMGIGKTDFLSGQQSGGLLGALGYRRHPL